MNPKEKLDNLSSIIATLESRDEESSNMYFREMDIDYDEIASENISKLKSMISEYKISKGRERTSHLQNLFTIFTEKVLGKSIEDIQHMYPSLPQLANRKFEEGKLSGQDADDLMKDASFLEFLESEFHNDSE